jgi:hypothetical protein
MRNVKYRVLGFAVLAGLFLIGSLMRSPELKATAYSSPVTVTNTSAQPVPNRDQDNPAQQPFQATASTVVAATGYVFNVPLYTVPAGKRAVIEYLSGSGNCNAQAGVGMVTLNTLVGGIGGYYNAGVQSVGDCNWIVNLPLRAYADPGTVVTANIWSFQTTTAAATLTVSGHLVNIP